MASRHAPARLDAGWRFRAGRPDAATLAWLHDSGSLTARLVALSGGRFRVRITRLAWERPALAEVRALGMRTGEWALVREVVLEGNGTPWVIARSVIPRRTLVGANRRLRHLGSRPLGAFLFRDPTLRREGVTVVRMRLETRDEAEASAHPSVWGRRSTFLLRGHPLLVAEYFLPALLAKAVRPGGPAMRC